MLRRRQVSQWRGLAKEKVPVKKYEKHVGDWKEGYPTWKDGKGKGLIGAVAYLSGKGANSISFLPYNAGGGDTSNGVGHFRAKNNAGKIIQRMLLTTCSGIDCASAYTTGPKVAY